MGLTNNSIVIWDGIVTASPSIGATNGQFDVVWEGTLLFHENAPDAAAVEDPFRRGSAASVESAATFKITGKAMPADGVADGDRFKKYSMKFTRGPGWALDGAQKKDKEFNVIASLQWRGSSDGSEQLCYASGEDDFGQFIGLGYMKPGNRITLCRRSGLDASDSRAKWSPEDIQRETLMAIYDKEEEDITVRPPWKCDILKA